MAEHEPMRKWAGRVLRKLAAEYPAMPCPLDHADPLQLLVATILSAQCTDERVNTITPALFARYPDAAAFAAAKPRQLEKLVRPSGYYKSKARRIIDCCKQIVARHGGRVPSTLEELVELPGVGRKTANVILGHAFATPGITVDTHVGRLSRRLGLTGHKNPEKVERDLMALVPRPKWSLFSLALIFHGRRVCFARKPRCGECVLRDLCPKVGVEPPAA